MKISAVKSLLIFAAIGASAFVAQSIEASPGHASESEAAQSSQEQLASVESIETVRTVGELRTIIFLVRFLDSPDPPFTGEQAKEAFLEGDLDAYVREVSYGKAWVTGNVSGWHTLERNAVKPGQTRCTPASRDEIKTIADKEGIRLFDYDHIIKLTSGCLGVPSHASGGFMVTEGGITRELGWSDVMVNKFSPILSNLFPFPWHKEGRVLLHEFGHSLGLPHASTWTCPEGAILQGAARCVHAEYGNLFDIMGTGAGKPLSGTALHYNSAFKKDILNWLDEDSALTIAKSGTYTLNPMENGKGIRLVRIQTIDGKRIPFLLEYRRAIGFDATLSGPDTTSNQQGVMVYWSNPELLNRPRLIDMSPSEDQQPALPAEEVSLNVGAGSFSDEGTGITIGPVRNANDEAVTFDVTIGQPVCKRGSPVSVGFNSSRPAKPQSITPGNRLFSSFSFMTGDSYTCDTGEVLVEIKAPPGFQVSTPTQSQWKDAHLQTLSLGPLENTSFVFNVRASSEVAMGTYPFEITITNTKSGYSISGTVSYEVSTPPLSIDLKAQKPGEVPSNGPITIPFDTEVTLSWATTNASRCTLSWKEFGGAEGNIPMPSSVSLTSGFLSTGPLIGDRVYTLVCNDPSVFSDEPYEKQDSVEIKVEGAPTTPAIILTSPNGNEKWQVGQTQTIAWKSRGVSKVNIDLLLDGVFHQLIASGQLNTGEHKWAIPTTLSGTNFKVRVTSAADSSISDESDASFSIEIPVQPPSQNSPPKFGPIDDVYEVQVEELFVLPVSASDADRDDILSFAAKNLPQGARFVPLGDVNFDGAVNIFDVQLFLRFRTGLAQLDEFQLAVADANEDGAVDIQDSVAVSQLSAGTVPITKYRLVWQPSLGDVGEHAVTFVVGDGKSLVEETATIRVQLPPRAITVISPNGGERWEAGTSQIISWIADQVFDVNIDLLSSGAFSQSIATNLASTGQYAWTIPVELSGENFAVRITDAADSSVSDESDAIFSIGKLVPPIPPLELSLDRSHLFQDDPELLHIRGAGIVAGGTFSLRFKQGDVSKATFVFEAREDAELEIDFSSKKEELKALAPGTYDIEIERGLNSAAVTIKDFLVTKHGDLPDSEGKRDAKINVFDVSRMLSHFDTAVGNTDYAVEFDINAGPNDISKGKVDLYDANLLMANWTD